MATWSPNGWSTFKLPTEGVDEQTALINTKLNAWSQSAVNYLSNSAPGTYVYTRDSIPTKELNELVGEGLIDQSVADRYLNATKENFRDYYSQTIVAPWDASLGLKPPAGEFDPTYYGSNNPDAVAKWDDAVKRDDLDIIQRYSKDNYLLQDYTRRTLAGETIRANAETPLTSSTAYQEKLTDAEYQAYRDQILGLATPEQPTTALEQELQKTISTLDQQKQRVFGALTQDVLKQTLSEIKAAKMKESNMDIMKSLTGFEQTANASSSLVNSLLGDSGIGGILSLGGATEEEAKNQIASLTGLKTSNSVIYNWQNWFDNVLSKRYNEGLTLQDPVNADVQYQVDKDFAAKFVTEYLKPRFDTSKSMDEFVSYIDVKQGEENIFQTQNVALSQNALDSLRTLADTRAKAYLDGIQNKAALNFDPTFYFNPTGNEDRVADYAQQAQEVAADWEAAKKGDPYWKQEAYRYGIDVNNKDQFARLHYEVKGTEKGYDAAKDVITLEDASNYISNSIIPAVIDKQIALNDTAFLKLVTPEEFANKILEGVDPSQNAEWQKVLTQFGLQNTGQGVEDVKNYIIEALRTGSAATIRKSIDYLNQKRLTPTQERLGITYIQRPEDAKKTTISGETMLYKTFRNAGYRGTEDDFYTTFMPDVDRNEQITLTKATTSGGLTGSGFSFSDPFQALSSISSMEGMFSPTTSGAKSAYSTLFEDTMKDTTTEKSKSGQDILSDFTSMFKGFM
jgi:hypothetical protein